MMQGNAEPLRARNVVLGALELLALAAHGHALRPGFPPPRSSSLSDMYVSLSDSFAALKRSLRPRERKLEARGLEETTQLATSNDTGSVWVVDTLYEGQNFYE